MTDYSHASDTTSTGADQMYDITQARTLILATPAANDPDVISAVLHALQAIRDQ